ncbi:hypothetical protein [Demequina sp. NBRC 110051]|uniref:hypothetical protein n=1 Tax=Demequina sp. NBRC 110051 TaxID=1570340 RepID=UPI000A03FDDE|nr:hypothetical protein [Demequina sp. NBRC 110051]
MWIIHRDQVGQVAFRRMLREGVIVPLLPGLARAPDVPESRGLRAAAVGMHARPEFVASGLAALWVHFGGTAPVTLDLVSTAHHHSRSWKPAMDTRMHASRHDYGGAVACPADALVDSLRWGDLADALPRAYALLGDGRVAATDAVAALDRIDARDYSWRRAWGAWGALREAQGRPIRPAGAASRPAGA